MSELNSEPRAKTATLANRLEGRISVPQTRHDPDISQGADMLAFSEDGDTALALAIERRAELAQQVLEAALLRLLSQKTA